MLNQKERYGVLLYLHYCCQFAPLPAKVNLKTYSLDLKVSPCRKAFSLLSHTLFLVNAAFKIASLVYVVAFEKETPLYQLILQGTVAWVTMFSASWYWIVYIQNLEVHATLVNMILNRADDSNIGSFNVLCGIMTFHFCPKPLICWSFS